MIMTNWPVRAFFVLLIAALTIERPAIAQTDASPEEFTAIAVPLDDPETPSVIDIRIIRWSTDREQRQFARLLWNDGPDALLEALRDARPVGRLESPGNPPWELRFAREERTRDGGRRMLLLTDRPIDLWEVFADSESLDFPFSVLELHVDSDGNGDGLLSIATKITVARSLGTIDLESYEGARLRLTEIHRRTSTEY